VKIVLRLLLALGLCIFILVGFVRVLHDLLARTAGPTETP